MKTSKLFFLIFSFFFFNCLSNNIIGQEKSPQKPEQDVVALKIPGMENVILKKDMPYFRTIDSTLKMDIYYPPKFDFKSRIPAIVFIFGYTNRGQINSVGKQLRKFGQYTSWSQVVAASGMAAIVYETINPENDLVSLVSYLSSNSDKLSIDNNRIGAFSCSANTAVALANILDSNNYFFKCAAIYYGIFMDNGFKYLSTIDTLSKKMLFIPTRLPESTTWRKDVPLLIVHVGKDFVPHTDESLTGFTDKAINLKIPFTLIHYATGVHGFDVYADNEETRQIIRNTIEFWKFNLKQ